MNKDTKNENAEQLKFRIKEILDSLPHNERREIIKNLPSLSCISKSKLYRLMNAKDHSNEDLPGESLIKLSIALNTTPSSLYNKEINLSCSATEAKLDN